MSCNPNLTPQELREKIAELKQKRNAIILAHNYVLGEIQDIADFCGDSLELSIKAAENTNADTIVFCGVRFMAETAKILSPGKKVLLPTPDAGCAMADMIDLNTLNKIKKQYPDAVTVCYVNSTAEVKTGVDICCTSANAERIVASIPAEKEVIMVPDGNLGANVGNALKRKIILYNGFCPIHNRFTRQMIEDRRREFPEAVVIVHPECAPDITAAADAALSTGAMLGFVKNSPAKMFIIGTEIGIIYRLRKENPDKIFIPLTEQAICPDMKKCELFDVYIALRDMKEEIILPQEVIDSARGAIEKMLK